MRSKKDWPKQYKAKQGIWKRCAGKNALHYRIGEKLLTLAAGRLR
jgi:hypothetical protein